MITGRNLQTPGGIKGRSLGRAGFGAETPSRSGPLVRAHISFNRLTKTL